MVLPAGHGVRAQQHVASVPEDEGERDGEPEESELRGRVRQTLGLRDARGRFGGAEVGLWEVGGVFARGNHGC